MRRLYPAFPLLCLPLLCPAQEGATFLPDIPVHRNGTALGIPWAGGLHAPQFSGIDLNQDGLQDLFVFDRAGNKALFFLNTGTAGHAQYTATREYDHVHPFPLLHDWALLRDYNCDGRPDVFAYTNAAFAVYRNTSDADGLSFTLFQDMVGSNYVPTISPNLYISGTDLPGIADIDGDGDLDVLTYSIAGNIMEYHKNLSVEQYGHCDSLSYEVRSRCWGDFQFSVSSSGVTLNMPCPYNVSNPELPAPGPGHAEAESGARAHSGNTILPIDLNGDGLTDLVLGDFETPHITAMINGGSPLHATMISADSLFPPAHPAHFREFLATFHVDIDGDGKRDLVVAPNTTTQSENHAGIWYYRNTGTEASPVFTFQQPDLLQGDMIDLGSGSRPVLFDHNGDGLMDIVVGNDGYFQSEDGSYRSRLALLENIGSPTAPAFNLVTDDYAGLSALDLGPSLHPAFGDVNGDGKADMVVGDLAGNLRLFVNVGEGTVAQFQPSGGLMTNDQGAVIDVGANAAPQLFDLDGDGLLDLVVGERSGNLNLYRNTGTAQVPQWHLETEHLGGVSVNEYWSVTGYSVPFLYRNPDDEIILVSGSEWGGLYRYEGISGNVEGPWQLTDTLWHGLYEGAHTAVALYDFLGEGRLAMVVGNSRGGLSFWQTGEEAVVPDGIQAVSRPPFSLAPNPARDEVEVRWHAPALQGLQVELLDGLGRRVRSMAMPQGALQLPLSGLAEGLYTVRLVHGPDQWSARLAIIR